jgi:hypothetical protein
MNNETKRDNIVLLLNRLKSLAIIVDLNVPYKNGYPSITTGYDDIIALISKLRTYIKEQGQLNSQEYLNFEDNLNKLSITDPND